MKKRTVYGTPITPNRLVRQLDGSSFCVSYWNRKRLGSQLDELIELTGGDELLLVDNGAFSAWNKNGAEPFLDPEYTAGFEAWALWILAVCPQAVAVIPDTITGTLAQNKQLLAETNLPRDRAMPVYHMHEPLEHLADLIRDGWLWIAFGSSGEFAKPATPEWRERMAQMWETVEAVEAEGYPRPWIHMMRAQAQGADYPFDSSDSTSVAVNHCRYKHEGGDYVRRYADRIKAKIDASCDGVEDVERLGGTPAKRGEDWLRTGLVQWTEKFGTEAALRRVALLSEAVGCDRAEWLECWSLVDDVAEGAVEFDLRDDAFVDLGGELAFAV